MLRCSYCDTLQKASGSRCESCGAGLSEAVFVRLPKVSFAAWSRGTWALVILGSIFLAPMLLPFAFMLLFGGIYFLTATTVGHLVIAGVIGFAAWEGWRRRNPGRV